MKKFICLLLIISSLLALLCSCSKPPEFDEIKGRLSELIEVSYGVNEIIFGEGLPTYERIYDPRDEIQYYENEELGKRIYYYYIEDDVLGKILAYRKKSYGNEFSYLLVSKTLPKDGNFVYEDKENGLYYLPIEYEEKESVFYYNDSFPADYDVVTAESDYHSIAEIKEYAKTVYSDEYLNSIYQTLFDGVMVSGDGEGLLKARYIEYTDENGAVWLMMSNTYEPLVSEKRIFDLSTAKILRGSNKNFVRIELDSYLEGKPEQRLKVTLSMILQDGVWMLDGGTY